jgi:hypothetical protein
MFFKGTNSKYNVKLFLRALLSELTGDKIWQNPHASQQRKKIFEGKLPVLQ